MTIALDAASVTNKFGPVTITPFAFKMPVVIAPGSDRLLMVAIGNFPYPSGAGTTITSVTYGGVAMTVVDVTNGTVTNGAMRSSLYYLLNPNAGTAEVVVTMAQSSYVQLVAAAWVGVAQTAATAFGTAVKATGTSTAPSVTVSSAVDEFVMDAAATVNTATSFSAVGAGQTVLGRLGLLQASSYEPGAASTVMNWTLSASAAWGSCAVPIKPSTAVSPPTGGTPGSGNTTVSEMRITPLRGAPWGFSAQQEPKTRNLITNSDFESGVSNWSYVNGTGGSIAQSTFSAITGTHCLKLTTGDNTTAERASSTGIVIPRIGTYTARAWVLPPNGQQLDLGFSQSTSGLSGKNVTVSAVGDGTTWQHLTVTSELDPAAFGGSTYGVYVAEHTITSGSFYVDAVEMYVTPAMLENNAAALEASGMYPKVLMGTIQPNGEIVWDDIYTLPSVAPATKIEVSMLPTKNSPNGSLIVTTQDMLAVYPLPFGIDPSLTGDPVLARSRSDAGSLTDLVPVFYPPALDFGTGLYELCAVQCIGQDFTYGTDSWAYSYSWGDTAVWETVKRLKQPNAVFFPAGRNRGSRLRTAISINDGAVGDPIGPTGRHIIYWVRQVDENGNVVKQADRAGDEVS